MTETNVWSAVAPSGASTPGIEQLRSQRGAERATFNEVADHMTDFMGRHPEGGRVVDELAAFLAAARLHGHAHDGHGSTSLEYDDT